MNNVVITINNKKVVDEFNNNATVSDVVQNILSQEAYTDQIISQIIVDGKELSTQEEDDVLPLRLGQFENINFTLKSNLTLAFEALHSCNGYIDNIISQISALTASYQACQTDESNILFAEVIEITDLYIQLVSRIQRTLKAHLQEGWEKPHSVQQLEIHLLSILKAIIPAKEKNDLIMLCDLLEYELVDNLKQWKIKALPDLRALRTACDSFVPQN
ncbi:MAG: hypothetical protein COW01_15155 [Bdellovibrionales bacterium CG12_big_fil_rev_8_21_14_0_65_38_15]|nr:MAG: hypothetical protein COW79_04630 [Bdellovibrionales bacterium CG22_combo_CG10-13_8_21_14_all_38_13]PIQ52701.1 MAG: hypothetical protein COW01_15155 [Bdellovibrionales bacterium CG12_big_fil_rev_8_21_14_0_65_38_15]PIR31066.1 MAG: hypothetical protein COV38_02250 [Bdellovibrionales bacterium CG11_big_fil_rev_8_21_14_0_20_38_13]